MLTLAVSACLAGLPTRYDGTAKPEDTVIALRREHRLLVFCPECGCGLGTPRPKIRLVQSDAGLRLIRESDGEDLAPVMALFAVGEIRRLLFAGATGFIVKSRSPSCGLVDTPVENGGPGAGLFVRQLLEIVPDIPIIDEKAWQDPERRAAFLEQAAQWRFRQ